MRFLRVCALFLVAMAMALPAVAAPAKPLVAVSILPQSYFVNRIAGDRVKVMTIVGPGQSPHSYEPTPRQMSDLSKAALWFTIGVDFEHALVPKIHSLYPALKLVDTTSKIVRRTIEAHHDEEEAEHHHEEGEDHDEEGPDPHTWLGRATVKLQAEEIRAALAALDPAGAAVYRQNYEAFVADIDRVFDGLAKELAPLRGTPVFVYHPAFGYFLDEFGIIQKAVETGGKEPTQKGLAELAAQAKEEEAKAIFVQAQFPTAAAKTLAASIGGVVIPLDALAPDWLANITRMGEALKKAAR
jgi:zinc transport system substrate-binding protein